MGKLKMIARTVAAGVCAFGISAAAHAAVDTPAVIGSSVTTTDCPQLSANITTGTSKGVIGAYVCRAADAVAGTLNRVGIGTCHPGGSAKARAVSCSIVSGTSAAAGNLAFQPEGCSASNFEAAGADGEPGALKAGADGQVQVTGLTMFGGATTGGQVSEVGMASTSCTSGALPALVGETYQ